MATKDDIFIDQGATFNHSINLIDDANNPLNITGYSAFAQMKKWYTSLNYIPFTTTINANLGVVTISLTANTTSNTASGRYVYDLLVLDTTGNVSRTVQGIAVVTPGVTNISIETTANTYNSNNYVVVPLNTQAP